VAAAFAITVRWVLVADLMLLFGVPLFAVCTAPGVAKTGRILGFFVFATAGIGMLLSVLGILILAASMNGTALRDVDFASVTMVVTATAVGTAFLVRIGALATAFALGLQPRGARAIAPLVVPMGVIALGAIALGSLAWSGHGVMDDGLTGVVHLIADIVHLLAAGIWVGALGSLLWRLLGADRDGAAAAHGALAGFATLGTASVALVLVSGVINSWLLVGPGNLLSLGRSLYGQLLLIKLALFGGMLALAALNRFRLTPGLGAATTPADVDSAIRRLRLSLMLETVAAMVILGLVAWLGTLEPPVSAIGQAELFTKFDCYG
jgi:putative copper resistance protein D